MTATDFEPPAHYADCAWPDAGGAARPGYWTGRQALDELRRYLDDPAAAPDATQSAIIDWVRRDVPELRSAAERVDPVELYQRVARTAVGEPVFRSGASAARHLGYGHLIEGLDQWRLDRFVGLGCPWIDFRPTPGMHVLDLGCGAGVDSLVAMGAVGTTGAVVGIDRLPFLLGGPRASAGRMPARVVARAELCPIPSGWADLVVANGLPPLLGARSAGAVLEEAHRCLGPKGEFRFTTLVVGPDDVSEALSDTAILDAIRCSKPMCHQYRTLLSASGFGSVTVEEVATPFIETYRPGPVRSVLIAAVRR